MNKFLHSGQFRDKFSGLREAYDNTYRRQLDRTRTLASENPTQKPSPLVDECLEYHARTYIINGFFEALNWPLLSDDNLPALIPEAPIQSLEHGTRRFLDYFGLTTTTQKPLILIEAKRPSLKLPSDSNPIDSDLPENISRRIAEGLKGESIGEEWGEILQTMKDYINSVTIHFSYSPLRAVITNGSWLILFVDPAHTFSEGVIDPDDIVIYSNPADIIKRAAEIWEYLEYSQVVGNADARVIQVGELPFSIDAKKIKKIMLGLKLKYFEQPTHDKARPEVIVLPIVLIFSQENKWIIIQRTHQGFDIPHKYEQLRDHFIEVNGFGSALLGEVLHNLNIQMDLSPISMHYEQEEDDFNEFKGVQEINSNGNRNNLEFIIITGNEFHFLHEKPSIKDCRFHTWNNAREESVAVSVPIMTPSVFQPRSFFVDGQAHHCTHSSVLSAKTSELNHGNRHECGLRSGSDGAAFCEIIHIEEYLCCRTCIFENICTKADIFCLPCDL
jgi:hypothetical protein